MRYPEPEPSGREAKPEWADVPAPLKEQIENIIGGRVLSAQIAWGGYGPTASFVLARADGKKFFAKGTHPGQTAHGAQMLHQEIVVYQSLPLLQKFSPRYLGKASCGGEDDWHIGVFDFLENTVNALPWTEEKITSVFLTLSKIRRNFRKEDCVPALPLWREANFVRDFSSGQSFWHKIADLDSRQKGFCTIFSDVKAAGRWLEKNLPVLLSWEKTAPSVAGPEALLHFDLRSDNILFSKEDGRAFLLDWPNACWGPWIFDLAGFLPSMAGESGLPPALLLEKFQRAAGVAFTEPDILGTLAPVSGYFALNAWRDVPEKLPRLRWIQRLQLFACLRWLEDYGIDPAPSFRI